MTRLQAITEIKALIDQHPLEDVETIAIVEHYTSGMELGQAAEVRRLFASVLNEMKNRGEIAFSKYELQGFWGTTEGVFIRNTLKIRSTMDYEDKKANKIETNTLTIGDGFTGNVMQNSNHSLADFRPTTNPSHQATQAATRQGQNTSGGNPIRSKIFKWIVSVITALLIAYLIYRFGWN